MIINLIQQNLTLNPGLYSIDLDGYIFNASVNSKRIRSKLIHSFISTVLEL
jgi:hypothetical protein